MCDNLFVAYFGIRTLEIGTPTLSYAFLRLSDGVCYSDCFQVGMLGAAPGGTFTPAFACLKAHPVFDWRLGEGRLGLAEPSGVTPKLLGVAGNVLRMEKAAGDTLGVLRDARPPVATALAVFGKLVACLVALWRQGVVHRDIKLDNIMLYEDTLRLVRGARRGPSAGARAGSASVDLGSADCAVPKFPHWTTVFNDSPRIIMWNALNVGRFWGKASRAVWRSPAQNSAFCLFVWQC